MQAIPIFFIFKVQKYIRKFHEFVLKGHVTCPLANDPKNAAGDGAHCLLAHRQRRDGRD
jgi:hypothetical protein